MARLVIKNGYLKGGKAAAHLNHLVKYIATRDGVDKMTVNHGLWRSTKKQQSLIAQILREFPDSKESLEYEDYLALPNRENASEFITATLEQHIEQIGGREKYLDYIANRPRVEKLDSHGLFTAGDEKLVLEQVASEVSAHTGNVWTPIISLRREDAEKFGYESAFAWKALLSSKALELAESLKIHPDHLKWYVAFHNESHHPHVHMVCYSANPNEGYLTKPGIRKMKSALATEIFRWELIPLYGEKTQRRDDLTEQSRTALRELLVQMQSGTLQNEKIEQLIAHLTEKLTHTTGRKQYGYLKAELKNVVDEIVDELARDERVAETYRLWQEVKGQINHFYSDKAAEPLPLSKCEDFKSIRNMVIKEALALSDGAFTFEESVAAEMTVPDSTADDTAPPPLMEDDAVEPECDTEQGSEQPLHDRRSKRPNWWTEDYKLAKQYLFGDEENGIAQDFEQARKMLLTEAEQDNPLAMCDLGRMCADGLGCDADADAAHQWYAKGLAAFHAAESESPWKYTQYRIGKMYAAGLGTEQSYATAAHWLTLSANEKYKYAEYSLGGLYYRGNGVEQSFETAFDLYTRSANQSFPYASFELGKMFRDGIGCAKNNADSDKHFADAFTGFTALEKQSHDDKLQYRLGWMLLNGVGTEKDEATAKEYFEKAAAVGNPFACYQLAKLILSDETSSPQEVEKALVFLKQAAASENPYAQYFLGKLYEKGQFVPQNTAEAVRLYKLSAAQDNDYAAYRLGKLYLGGEGVLKDVDEAIRWLDFAAEKKNQYAQYALGILYLKGEDVPKDITKAIEFLSRAAVQQNQFAQYRLGKIYLTGEDAPKDIDAAIRYLTAAAEHKVNCPKGAREGGRGNQYAQYTLGKLYLMGKEVPRDKETAAKWFTLSATQGNIYAQFFLDHMDEYKDPSVMLAATRLLHHMSRIMGDTAPARMPPNQHADRKLMQKIRAKKQAQGHARDDHEQTMHTL
ncbi:MobP3 family relaxase [Anaerotruncus rubiinfantis]|uniref:MobP3 family relaxase n=1 Tax=Anaerotruncus rubiinfantis TaxID=1720200 RepID=UPI000834D75D|nr:MobP3 family relaxase [Anaerotruncus rubiinfantis]